MNPLRHRFESLARQQEGTMMTEFVIALPIFLFFFSAIFALGNLTQGVIQTHADAAPELWVEVYAAEELDEALDPDKADVFGREEDPDGLEANLDAISTSSGGQWEESQQTLVGIWNVTGEDLPGAVITRITTDPSDIIGDSMAAAAVAHDQSGNAPTGTDSSTFGQGLSQLLNEHELSLNAGWAGGTRYGAVASQMEKTVNPGYGLDAAEYAVEYTSRISPSPGSAIDIDAFSGDADEWLEEPDSTAWAATRMWVNEQQNYSRLFELGEDTEVPDLRLDRSEVNNVDPFEFEE